MTYFKLFFIFIIIATITSCKNDKNTISKQNDLPIDSINNANEKIIRAIGETLTPEAKEKVEDWNEYQQLDDFLENFYSSSPNETLNLSKELSTTTKQLQDSLKIERFMQPDVRIRLNVIHNYALRLADMATIPSIETKEVQEETQNILDAFSALNSKINSITKQEQIEKELDSFNAPITIQNLDSLPL